MGFDLLRRGGSVVALRFFEAITGSAANLLRRASAHMARIDAGQPIDETYVGGGTWEVDIAGKRYPAVASIRPLYDPGMNKVKS